MGKWPLSRERGYRKYHSLEAEGRLETRKHLPGTCSGDPRSKALPWKVLKNKWGHGYSIWFPLPGTPKFIQWQGLQAPSLWTDCWLAKLIYPQTRLRDGGMDPVISCPHNPPNKVDCYPPSCAPHRNIRKHHIPDTHTHTHTARGTQILCSN